MINWITDLPQTFPEIGVPLLGAIFLGSFCEVAADEASQHYAVALQSIPVAALLFDRQLYSYAAAALVVPMACNRLAYWVPKFFHPLDTCCKMFLRISNIAISAASAARIYFMGKGEDKWVDLLLPISTASFTAVLCSGVTAKRPSRY